MSLTFKQPKKSCDDKNCPFHGTLPVRGRVLDGVVATAKMDKTVVVEREYLQFSKKFVRYERRRGHIPSLQHRASRERSYPRSPAGRADSGRQRGR